MTVVFKVSPDRFDEISLDKFAEALVSPTPPLSGTARREISGLQERRLAELTGDDLRLSKQFFDHAGSVPPLEGAQVHDGLTRVLPYLAEYHKGRLVFPERGERPAQAQDRARGANEWGFAEFPVTMGDPTRRKFIHVDIHRSVREGKGAGKELIRTLFELNKPELASQLVADFGTMILYRFDIDISANS